ncbi:MAG TPA: MarR family transcriptional regulator [Coriobacteriia bacterium]|nr:MarR family transcriptional regulator [Coriobacteriia bacterium]
MEYEALKLKNQLCFPLYAAAKEVVSKYKPYLDEVDLTYTQYIAMMVLWEQNRIGVSELGEHLHLDSGTLTPMLKRLEDKGFVRRERDKTDERAVNIILTDKGTALADRASVIPMQVGSCLPLSAEEATTLYALLYKLLED